MIGKEKVERIIRQNDLALQRCMRETDEERKKRKYAVNVEKRKLIAEMETLSDEELFDLVSLAYYGMDLCQLGQAGTYPVDYQRKRAEMKDSFQGKSKNDIVIHLSNKSGKLSDYLRAALPILTNQFDF